MAVFKHLNDWVRKGKVPGKRPCEMCISKANGALDGRQWRKIKYFVKNEINKRKNFIARTNRKKTVIISS